MLALQTGVMWSQAKECQKLRETKRGKTQPPLEPLEEVQPAETWILASDADFSLLASRTVRRQISVVLKLQVCGSFSQQPQVTNAGCKATRACAS